MFEPVPHEAALPTFSSPLSRSTILQIKADVCAYVPCDADRDGNLSNALLVTPLAPRTIATASTLSCSPNNPPTQACPICFHISLLRALQDYLLQCVRRWSPVQQLPQALANFAEAAEEAVTAEADGAIRKPHHWIQTQKLKRGMPKILMYVYSLCVYTRACMRMSCACKCTSSALHEIM